MITRPTMFPRAGMVDSSISRQHHKKRSHRSQRRRQEQVTSAMKHFSIVLFIVIVAGGCAAAKQDNLARSFAHPPDSAKPRTWWHWVSGNVSKEGITADLEAMKRIGVGGAQCFSVDQAPDPKDRGKVLYMSPEWQDMVKHAISESNRLGLELTITPCEGWSESGGPWIKPEQS